MSYSLESDPDRDIYVITTAKKRDSLDWEDDAARLAISTDREKSYYGIKLTVDSWNNVSKYTGVEGAFFIFDEQRVVGSGTWVKSFLRITRRNKWILLSATPGDTWSDYIPVFLANGFYKNRTEFLREHAVYSRYSKYPKVEKWIGTSKLERLRRSILVDMDFERKRETHSSLILCDYDKDKFDLVMKKRWDPWDDCPIQESGKYYYLMRRVVNEDPSRLEQIRKLHDIHPRLIVFYNFEYERQILRQLSSEVHLAEWNGKQHDPVPEGSDWIYIVQYTAGAEGWNCITTDAIAFYSLNYSYRIMHQSEGRIDRLNTPYKDLYYYRLRSKAPIDMSISKALAGKKTFNEERWKVTDS